MMTFHWRPLLPVLLVLDAAQLVLSISPTCYGIGGDGGACEAGMSGHLFHIPEKWSGQRALKQAVWSSQVDIMPPAFVTWEPADTTGMALHGFKIDSLFGCSDRTDWNMPWPPPLDIFFSCNDYAPGGVNDMFCDVDQGWSYAREDWMLASAACPRACQQCCFQYCRTLGGNANQINNCAANCARPFEVPFDNGTHIVTRQIDDPFLAYLNTRGTYQRYMDLLNQTNSERTSVFEPVEFEGGEFLEAVNVSMLTLDDMFNVHYTTDRSVPTFTNGELGSFVTIDRNTHLQAVAFEPDRETPFESRVVAVDIRIKALPPRIDILECELEGGATLVFNSTFVYSDQMCVSALVTVTAINRRAEHTFLRYALGGQGARPTNPQGQASVTFIVAVPGQVSAIAWMPDMVPSDEVRSTYIHIPALVAVSRGWQRTLGLWEFVLPERFEGTYSRDRNSNGGCGEARATRVEPAMVADVTELLGPAVLQGPTCKGGVWDLGAGLSPSLKTFVERVRPGGPVKGLRFDSLNRGLYVATDVSSVAPELLPREAMSVEVIFSVDSGASGVALAGLVGCRLDASASGGFRYGKGWSLGYSVDAGKGTTTVIFSLALERNEIRQGLGGMRDFTALVSPGLATGQLAHVVGVYDGTYARVYVNGQLLTETEACGDRWTETVGCGSILYPLATDDLYTQGRPAPLTIGVIDSAGGGALAPHVGVIRMARLMGSALSTEQVVAGARRRLLDGSSRQCPLGRFGPYEGLEPCLECAAGSVAPERGLERCEPCSIGFFTEGRGATDCLLCPPGMTTASEGSDECTADDCALGTHSCAAEAACVDTGVGPESYMCSCNVGYEGDGMMCVPACGDGIVVDGEECDDGNGRAGDGCSRTCQVEPDFACRQTADGASDCECLASAASCCSKEHALCRQLVEIGEREHLDCLSEYGGCLAAAEEVTRMPSPDVQLGQGSTPPPPGSAACNALHEACQMDRMKSGPQCLNLYSACLKAVVDP